MSSAVFISYGSYITRIDVIFVVLNKNKINLCNYNNIVHKIFIGTSLVPIKILYKFTLLIYAGKADEFTIFFFLMLIILIQC